ncbi:MAG: WD40/YVTN/BNR-like repeat-containing protein, partial [Pyrinomonadaceae bacterium]
MSPTKKTFLVLIAVFAFFQAASAGWVKQQSGTLAWLHAVYFVNQNKGWIVGSQGTFLSTEDGGKTWNAEHNFTKDNIRDVYFTDEKTGYLLCERDIYNQGTASASYLLKTEDGGANWEKIEFTPGRERIVRIFFAIGGYGFAVGESGTLLAMQGDKKTWKKTVLPVRFLMLDGNFSNALNGQIVGGNGTILFTEDAGLTWNPATVAGDAKPKLNSVFFINQKTGWSAGADGKIYATMNGGKYWREQNSTITKSILDIF